METNYYNRDDEERRMMDEEYGHDLTGCLTAIVCTALAAIVLVVIALIS